MYVSPNFKSKAAAKRAIAAGETVTQYAVGLNRPIANGTVAVEGPWYPEPHKWWGTATIKDGVVVKIV